MLNMKIPECLKLDQAQIDALNKFEASLENKADPYDECCCGSGFTFHIMPSGIGDSGWVKAEGRRFVFTYDDDGQIIGETDYK